MTFGKTAFYQSLFLGSHDNLLGFRQYRYAGQHMLYSNLKVRVRIADIHSYILPGQFGITGFYDAGRVWEKEDHSTVWHHGVGGGIYFAPAEMLMIQALVGHTVEGWWPSFSLQLRSSN
jgi:hemolysin activation/secretion protein